MYYRTLDLLDRRTNQLKPSTSLAQLDWWKHSLCWSVCPVQEMERAVLAVLAATGSGDLSKVKKLLGKGCPANAKDEVRYTHLSVYS